MVAMGEDANPRSIPPGDPSGIDEPHDVLAAEEFGMPVPGATTDWKGDSTSSPLPLLVALALGLALAVFLLRRR